MVKNRAQNVVGWTHAELFTILLRQFKRLLAEHDVELTEQAIRATGDGIAARTLPQDETARLVTVLRDIVDESLGVLRRWELTYRQALATTMNEMAGWETTADFLQLANEKGNAELRISAGSALLAGIGDATYADHLLATWENGKSDPEDVDAVIAKRALCFLTQVDDDAEDWEAQVHASLNK